MIPMTANFSIMALATKFAKTIPFPRKDKNEITCYTDCTALAPYLYWNGTDDMNVP